MFLLKQRLLPYNYFGFVSFLSLLRAVYTVLRGCHMGRMQVLRAPQWEDGGWRVVVGGSQMEGESCGQ